MWVDGYSLACGDGKCDGCDGYERVVDQDGNSTYLCRCSCHRTVVQEECPKCQGRGTVGVERHDAPRKVKKAYVKSAATGETDD